MLTGCSVELPLSTSGLTRSYFGHFLWTVAANVKGPTYPAPQALIGLEDGLFHRIGVASQYDDGVMGKLTHEPHRFADGFATVDVLLALIQRGRLVDANHASDALFECAPCDLGRLAHVFGDHVGS